MKQAEEVSYYNNSAKIYSAQDGYHSTWYFNGKRIKRQFKTLKLAKEGALQAMRQIHHGEGQLAQLSTAQKSALIHTQKLLQDHGITDPEMAMREYVSAKKIADGIDLTTVATYWANSRTTLETVSFHKAANDWIETRRPKWSKAHADKVITRTARLCKLFAVDLLDVDYESVRTFFNVDLRDNQPRYKNNFREIFRSIFKNAVERKWLPKEHGFTELLRNEPTVDKAKTIITPEQFRRMLLACNTQMLPVIALRGFCGIRREEVLRLSWEDVWSRDDHVEIPSEKAKTKTRRLIPRFAALETWLDSYRNMNGRLWKLSNNVFGHAQNDLYKQVGVSGDNVLRDAFATYRMAELQNEAQVAHEMGNSPRMIFKSYRELATPAEAERWFSVTRNQHCKKIIQIGNE
ncbi:hypothetical protein OAH15_00685 [bacterium]|nr:hypothetical protein [bacterium]